MIIVCFLLVFVEGTGYNQITGPLVVVGTGLLHLAVVGGDAGGFPVFYYTLTCTSKQSSKMYNNFACVLCSVLTCAMKQNVVQWLKVR